MKQCLFFLIVPFGMFAAPLEVPIELYSGWGKNDNHPGNAPLISDLTFRSICDHVIDQGTKWFDPATVKLGDTIYLNFWYINWFHAQVHDHIQEPYILVTCDVGNWHPDPVLQKLFYDPKLAAWFCRNSIFSYHPKIFQIPMGQTDRYFGDIWLPHLQHFLGSAPFEKKHFLYMNYLPRSWGGRDQIVKLFENEPYCFSRNRSDEPYSQIGKPQYYEEMAASIFALSPIGLETDCVRTWEALALDCIPIVEHSFLDPVFDELPVFLIHDWKDINESLLREKYEKLKVRSRDRAYFGFWKNKIQEMQNKIRTRDLSLSQLEATQFPSEDLEDLIAILKEEGNEHPFLICKGFLTTIHSVQIAAAAPFLSTIFLSDYWLYFKSLSEFKLKNPLWESAKKKITMISEREFQLEYLNYNSFGLTSAPIFLDLSYQRTTLLEEFMDTSKQISNFRHNLKNDLYNLYQKTKSGGLIIGNGGNHEYVQDVLSQLKQQYEIKVRKKGNFWFFHR